MSVPEWVRRKSGTMFSCHPPFAYSTAASTLSPASDRDVRIKTPPPSFYREYPIHSFAAELARRASSPSTMHTKDDDSAVVEEGGEADDGFRKEEVAAALFSSPRRAMTAPVGDGWGAEKEKVEEHHNKARRDDDENGSEDEESGGSSSIPDLLANTSTPPSPTISHHEAITPVAETGNPMQRHHVQEKLRCPHCGVGLQVVLEEEGEGEDPRSTHESLAEKTCACAGQKGGESVSWPAEEGTQSKWAGLKKRDGVVQVLRGAW